MQTVCAALPGPALLRRRPPQQRRREGWLSPPGPGPFLLALSPPLSPSQQIGRSPRKGQGRPSLGLGAHHSCRACSCGGSGLNSIFQELPFQSACLKHCSVITEMPSLWISTPTGRCRGNLVPCTPVPCAGLKKPAPKIHCTDPFYSFYSANLQAGQKGSLSYFLVWALRLREFLWMLYKQS